MRQKPVVMMVLDGYGLSDEKEAEIPQDYTSSPLSLISIWI
jgi:bisphosphoglycerate-independent phosphoglycerate mutase (AlkP superfamily)